MFPRKAYTTRARAARSSLGIPDDNLAVLSLDGGGVRGLSPLALLAKLEQTYGTPSYEIFDVILGTSTGSIIGSLIAAGLSADEIQKIYREEIHRIFALAREGNPSEPYVDEYVVDLPPALALVDRLMDLLARAGAAEGSAIDAAAMASISATVQTFVARDIDLLSKNLAARSLTAWGDDRRLRLLGGSPVYDESYIRPRLRSLFQERNCKTLSDLSKKNQCIVVFAAVDSETGASVFMSATGRDTFPGSCEDSSSASCVESSMSAPLYFSPFNGNLVDGGTLSANMPLFGALVHLERRSQRRVTFEVPQGGRATSGPPVGSSTGLVFQPFDLHATTIFSLGCGVGPLKPLNKAVLDISHAQRYYYHRRWPYGELSKLQQVIEVIPSNDDVISNAIVGSLIGGPIGLALGLWTSGGRAYELGKALYDHLEDTLKHKARFGVGATINAASFLNDGRGRDAWTMQEDMFRSLLYRGDFRRFQVSLDRDMQIDGLWQFHPKYDTRQAAARVSSYMMPWKVRLNGATISQGSYDVISVWDELVANGLKDFVPGLEPLGSLSLKWLDCIGARFADAVAEFCQSKSAAFMGVDLADEAGQDVFVASTCRNYVTPSRWTELKSGLENGFSLTDIVIDLGCDGFEAGVDRLFAASGNTVFWQPGQQVRRGAMQG